MQLPATFICVLIKMASVYFTANERYSDMLKQELYEEKYLISERNRKYVRE